MAQSRSSYEVKRDAYLRHLRECAGGCRTHLFVSKTDWDKAQSRSVQYLAVASMCELAEELAEAIAA